MRTLEQEDEQIAQWHAQEATDIEKIRTLKDSADCRQRIWTEVYLRSLKETFCMHPARDADRAVLEFDRRFSKNETPA